MAKTNLTAQRLRELLHYDPETGIFRWKVNTSNSQAFAGDIAGWMQKGYRIIKVDNLTLRAHRLAWLYMHGVFPTSILDHINRDKSDNRICNLREVSYSENTQNQGLKKNNKSGVKGVYWRSRDKCWIASIRVHGKSSHIGQFKSLNEAAEAYAKAAAKQHTANPSSEQAQQPAQTSAPPAAYTQART